MRAGGPLHRDVGLIGALGATLHVAAWIIALVMDILVVSKLDGGKTTDAIHYDYWLATFIPLVVGLAVVVVTTLMHALTTMKVPEGGMVRPCPPARAPNPSTHEPVLVPCVIQPPFLMTAMTGGSIICVIFTYLLLTSSVMGLHKYTEETDVDKKADFAEQFRRFAIWSLLAKVCKPHTAPHNCTCTDSSVPCALCRSTFGNLSTTTRHRRPPSHQPPHLPTAIAMNATLSQMWAASDPKLRA